MFKSRALALALAATAVTAAATGCQVQVGDPEAKPTKAVPSMKDDAPKPTSTPDVNQTGVADTNQSFSDSDVTQEINDAVQVVDTYWKTHWSEFFTGAYKAPQVKGSYNGDDPDRFTCGGEQATKFNAYYCKPEDYLAWDFGLMKTGFAQGDAWIYLVVAHEWGHAIQNRLQMGLVSADGELQADCLAGAVLQGAVRDGSLTWEPGDTTEIGQALSAFGDDAPWTDPTSHGDAIERVTAFGKGRTGGVIGCLQKNS